ncbi:MAG: hypothetical protein HZB31_13840 [Nitrospirae bacterium]|nr:hypothetical protein [Nitrospirota bacterium]
MKGILLAGVIVLICSALVYGHSGKHESAAKFTKHFNETLFAISEKGQVSIEVLLDEKEYKIGKDVIGIVIHDSHDEDVEDAKVMVTVTGIEAPLKVTEKGGGLYLASNTGLPKDGAWKLGISARTKKIEDGAAFSFPEVFAHRMPAGKYDVEALKPQKAR